MEARNRNDSWAQECWERTTPRWSQSAQKWALIYCWGKLQSEWGDGGGSPLLKPIISSVFPRDVFTPTCRLDVTSVEKKGNRSVLSWGSFAIRCSSSWSTRFNLLDSFKKCTIVILCRRAIFTVFFFFVIFQAFGVKLFSFVTEILWKPWKNKTTRRGKHCREPSHCLEIACESTWVGLFRSCCLFHCSGC